MNWMNDNHPKIGPELSRRGFLKGAAIAGASVVLPAAVAIEVETGNETTPGGFQAQKRPLGSTGLECSILGMGGFHLGTVADQSEVNNMVAKAIDHGINIFDNAWEFHRGLSEEKLGVALKGKRDDVIVMSSVCTHGPNEDLAMRMLDASLTRLQTHHLDVWQIHEVIYQNDPALIYASDSILEVLTKAKQEGKVRFVGFNGHKHPAINLEMLNRGYAFDVIQMPLNPLDPGFRSFEKNVLPMANRRGIAVLGMKSMGGSGELISKGAFTPSEALSYAMSLPVATTISGIDSMEVLDQNLAILRDFKPLSTDQMRALRDQCKQFNDGRYELYKSTLKYDSDLGRSQHGYPSSAELPL
jgi:aryl-alcohol dehydrogenase-like predicted oxidoreductase